MSVHQNVLVNLLDTSKAAPATAESSDKGERNLAVNFATKDEETYQAVAALVNDMPEIARLGKEEAHKAAVLHIIESMLPNIDVTLGDVLQAKRNKDARVQIMKAGYFTSEQVGKNSGSKAENIHATASRWKEKGRIFSVNYKGKVVYPVFQFQADGQPWPVVEKVLKLFEQLEDPEGWRTAGWFFANNGWLGGEAPKDLLETAPDKVFEAAKHKIAAPGY